MKKTKWFFIIMIIIAIFTATCNAEWRVEIGGDQGERGQAVQQTSAGTYIIASWVGYTGTPDSHDFGIIELNPDGNIIWQKKYGNISEDRPYSIHQNPDSSYILGGLTNMIYPDDFADAWLIKLNPDKTIAWQKKYGEAENSETFYSVQPTDDGGYIALGQIGHYTADVWILKLNSDGSIDWQKAYPWDCHDPVHLIEQTRDGGYIMAGYSNEYSGSLRVVKLFEDGSIDWQKAYPGMGGYHVTSSIKQTQEGGYIMTATTNFSSESDHDIWVAKIFEDGEIEWQKKYGAEGSDRSHSVQQTSDGGYILGATSNSFDSLLFAMWLFKLNSDGEIIWQKIHKGSLNIFSANPLQQTKDGGYVIVGMTPNSDVTDNLDLLVLKLNSNGEIPNCIDMYSTTDANIYNTSFEAIPTNVVSYNTNIMPLPTANPPQDSFFDSSFICFNEPLSVAVKIDIEPNSEDNCVNINESGIIPVAIFGTESFDVYQIDPSTCSLEGMTVKMVGKSNKYLSYIEDINYDGYDDLILKIEDSDGNFSEGQTEAVLTGNLYDEYDSTPIEGSDHICIAP